jgi:hypothetical protein
MRTSVLNLSTGQEQIYTCPAKVAVICAYAQSLGDWNTWDYDNKYSHLLREGKETWGCGDFCSLKEPEEGSK